jgi:two-component system NtrC family sensor kinase
MLEMNEVVDQALEIVGFDPRFKRVTIQRDYSPHVGSLPLLRQAMQQVLVNLLMNALDATASIAEPRVIVRTTARDGACFVEISDNGCGIAPEHMRRLFEPFFTTKPVGKGTGLGLSISYSLVQKHAGSISAKSELGRGTTFTIRLPSCGREPAPEGFAGNEKSRA